MPLIISSSWVGKDGSSQILFNPSNFDPDKLILVIDADRCIGCRACEVHCWNEHRETRENGETSIRVLHIDRSSDKRNEFVSTYPYPQMCSHCEEPECVNNCPAGAITKEETGIVRVYEEKCLGCQTCLTVCSNYFFAFSRDSGKTLKCDGCFHRLKQGLWPACATKCSMKAIYVGYPDEIARILKEKKVHGETIYIVGDSFGGRENE